MNHTLVIGITGGIGAGKSYVAKLLHEHFGIPTYDCDREAKRLNNQSAEIRQSLIQLVGPQVYGPDGSLQRHILADYLFASLEHARQINAIVHPVVRQDFKEWVDRQHTPSTGQAAPGRQQTTDTRIVALESAILFESGFDQLCHKTITVTAPLHLRIQRACQRDGADPEAIRRRIRLQASDDIRTQRADYVIPNDGNDPELISNLETIILNL